MNSEDVHAVLSRITFAPSCIDMGWKWQVHVIREEDMRCTGFLIRTSFRRPDTNTGEVSLGYGRWWHVPVDATDTAIVKTAFAACKLVLEHELMEAFKCDGMRIFDPHHTVKDLEAAVENKELHRPREEKGQ